MTITAETGFTLLTLLGILIIILQHIHYKNIIEQLIAKNEIVKDIPKIEKDYLIKMGDGKKEWYVNPEDI